MHFSMKISYLFSSVYGRARGGGSSAYCGTGSSAWWSHRIYLSCYIIDFSCDESQVLTDPVNNKQALAQVRLKEFNIGFCNLRHCRKALSDTQWVSSAGRNTVCCQPL